MGKKGKKGKDAEPSEPPHDPQWEAAVEAQRWDRPPDALPDTAQWPTWGAIRERVLGACKEVSVTWSPSMRDAFPAELVRLSPPELELLELHGASLLTRVVVSPAEALPALTFLDLNSCPALEFAMVQSDSLTTLDLSGCTALKKVLVQCKNLRKLNLAGCSQLETLMLWADELPELDLETCKELRVANIYAAKLQGEGAVEDALLLPNGGKLKEARREKPLAHPAITGMLKDMRWQQHLDEEATKERDRKMSAPAAGLMPKSYVRSY